MTNKRFNTNDRLNEVFVKAQNVKTKSFEDSLFERKLSFLLLEQLDQNDVKEVTKAIEEASKNVDEVFQYLDRLGDFDRSKVSTLEVWLGSMKDALDKARGELASANFETGAVSKFFGKKLTLPQITQAAIGIQTKANDFFTGFSNAMDNIRDNLGPLVKNETDAEKPLRDLAGQGGFPDENKLKSGINKAMKSALGGGFFKRISSFFAKGKTVGAEKRILEELPDLDINAFADQITDALLDSSMKSLKEVEPPPLPKDPDGLEDEARDAQEAETQSPSSDEAQQSGQGPPPLPAGSEAEKAQDQAQQELTQSIKDEAQEPEAPGVAVMNAIEGWFDGLAKSNQEKLSQAGRYESLKSSIQTTMDGVSDTVQNAVRDAISGWRSEHEETLIKSRRFSKKNFDSLEELIPKLAAAMMKKVNESHGRLTHNDVKKHVVSFLNRRFKLSQQNMLKEESTKYTVKEMEVYRLNKLAGFDR